MSDRFVILNNLLELKLHTLNVYATTGMTWWVSSVVFCGTIIGAAWIRKDDLEKFPLFELLGWLSTCIKDVLQDSRSESAIKIKAFIGNLRACPEVINELTLKRFIEEIQHLSTPHIYNLVLR